MLNHIKALLAIILLGLFALLPLRMTQALGGLMGSRFYRGNNKMARITRTNLALCYPEQSEAEREALIRSSLAETGKTILEMGGAWIAPTPLSLKRIRSVQGEEVLQEALKTGKGVILIAPHLGNWELLNLYVSKRYPITVMYKPPKWPLLDRLIRRQRARIGSAMAPASRKGVMMVLKALRRGEMVGILPDQEPERSGGLFAPFFGVQALTMKLVSQLALETGAIAVCGYARRLPKGAGYEICFRTADGRIHDRPLEASITALNRSVEACVRDLPEQYQWEYRRFEQRPDGDSQQVRYD